MYINNYLSKFQSNEIQSKISKKVRREISKIEDLPIFNTINKLIKIKTGIDLEPDSAKCDEVFSEYLLKSKNHCNKDYTVKLITFVLLFREALNIVFGEKLGLSNIFLYEL